MAEVWAAGAHSDDEVHREMRRRIAGLGTSPKVVALTEVIESMGRVIADLTATPEPQPRESLTRVTNPMSPLVLRPEEPAAGPWERWPLARLADAVAAAGQPSAGQPSAGPLVVAVVVHTDDVAWHHSFFGWADLLIEGALEPAAAGRAVSFRPPAWEEHGRPGAIAVPEGTRYLLVEGVGASRRELDAHTGFRIWVQSDFFAAERRGIERDVAQAVNGNAAESFAFWHEWMAQEIVFLAEHRPWERADLMVCGTPTHCWADSSTPGARNSPHQWGEAGPDDDVLVAAPPPRSS